MQTIIMMITTAPIIFQVFFSSDGSTVSVSEVGLIGLIGGFIG